MKKYAIFDLDGTLLDSMWVWENIDRDYLARYNCTPSKELREEIKSLSFRQSAELFKTKFNLAKSIRKIMDEITSLAENQYKNEVTLKPFVFQFLQKLKQQGVKMCIATASVKKNVTPALERLGIIDFFDFIITADDVAAGKDNPEMFLLCAEKFDAKPKEVMIFEDALHAVVTAKNAGFYVVGVYDQSAGKDIDKIKEICHYYITDFSEMRDIS